MAVLDRNDWVLVSGYTWVADIGQWSYVLRRAHVDEYQYPYRYNLLVIHPNTNSEILGWELPLEECKEKAAAHAEENLCNEFNPRTDPRRPSIPAPYGESGGTVMQIAVQALEHAQYTKAEVEIFTDEARTSDYDQLIEVVEKWMDYKETP